MERNKLIFKFWPFAILFFFTILIAWPLFLPGYFSHHDDLQVMRIFEMRKCIEDLQIPCRWVPDMGYGNGYPLFNYYSVFPYYIGATASYLVGFVGSAKLIFFLAVSFAGISMYFFVRELFGTYPALTASALYMFAPYRALDIYVRGAIAESFSIAIIPLVFFFALKLIKHDQQRFRIGLTLSFAAFLLSHNIMIILFLPVIISILFIWYWKKNFKTIKTLVISLFLGFCLSAFFIVPAYMEQNLVQIDNLVRFSLDFRGHFINLYQLFLDRSWGYGVSSTGTADTMSFQIGWPHYFLVIASVFSLLVIKRKERKLIMFNLVLLAAFVFSLFMTHVRSAFIWEQIGILRFVQFPWRFLSVAIFTASLLGAFFVYSLKESFVKITVALLILSAIILNVSYFKPQQFIFNLTDEEKLSGQLWETQQKAAILDYLPVGALEPRESAPLKPAILAGDAVIKNFQNRSNSWHFQANVTDSAIVEVPIFDFPNWQVFANGKKINHSNKNYLGRISFTLPSGEYFVVGKFNNTLVRTVSNTISLISIFILIGRPLYEKSRRNNK
ncbi:MAG: 6-pyruvoyl-tetrahydropterin synthase-related protein [Candidatus Daviesbacteria bacterium]|nr:6-pyruvoyl-tetrahydropterin synthase-related protein [Candidatus Daviesbacteria bacterium]